MSTITSNTPGIQPKKFGGFMRKAVSSCLSFFQFKRSSTRLSDGDTSRYVKGSPTPPSSASSSARPPNPTLNPSSLSKNHENPNIFSKDIPFYWDSFEFSPKNKTLLTKHGVVDSLLRSHLKKMQEKLWHVFPYPCIGVFDFIIPNLPAYPSYPHLMTLLRRGGIFLDSACCVGQDLRHLATEGIPAKQLYGFDLHQEFIDLGHELFFDTPTSLGAKVLPADVFDTNSWLHQELLQKCAVIHLGNFLHLFNYDRQMEAAVNLVRLLELKKGNMIVGLQVGSFTAAEYNHPTCGNIWRHDVKGMKEFLQEVGRRVGARFKVEVIADEPFRKVSPDGTKVFCDPPFDEVFLMRFSAEVM